MKITKRQLRRIIRESCGDMAPAQSQAGMPCPHGTAASIQQSGASPEEILAWIHDLLMDLTEDSQQLQPEELYTDEISEFPIESVLAEY